MNRQSNDKLYQAAAVWKELTEYCYIITYGQISKGIQYENLVNPRLESLIRLKDILEKDFKIFYFMPHKYPFTTMIKADYLISCHLDLVSFVFIIQSAPNEQNKSDYLCCSAFTKGSRDYEANQPSRTILKKERLHIKTQTSTVLYNRLTFS